LIGIFFDQATWTTGYSIYDGLTLKDYGHYSLDRKDKENKDPYIRIQKMKKFVDSIIEKVIGEIYGIEDTYFEGNYTSYKELSALLGTLKTDFNERHLLSLIIEAKKWKSTCKIKGRKRQEQKENSIKFVHEKFGLETSEDEADAIAIGWHVMSKEVPKIRVIGEQK
jgi:Holliday junction resolvasome RuvABC endonuclease subunit